MVSTNHELKLARQDGIAILTLNRPEKLNALTYDLLFRDLPALLRELASDKEVKVLVMTGEGRGFCAGMDVGGDLTRLAEGAVAGTTPEPYGPRYGTIHLLRTLPKPTIAAVNGPAAGAGFSLAAACDIRIASENASFCSAFIRRGLIPDCGLTYLLPRLVGSGHALELMYTGRKIDSREADRIGLVNRVVAADDLMSATMALAAEIAQNPPIALMCTKRLINLTMDQDLMAQLENEAYQQTMCRVTEDFKEGVLAFQERRPPVFKGR